jgi:hypothetical protein
MEIRQVHGLPLKIYTDTVAGFSYLTFLSNYKIEKIRLPKEFSQYKQNYLLSPNYILDLEIIKTKKNWVLKDVISSSQIINLQSWDDYLKHSEQTSILLEFLREEQEVDILIWLKNIWSQKLYKNQLDFRKELESRLGFA